MPTEYGSIQMVGTDSFLTIIVSTDYCASDRGMSVLVAAVPKSIVPRAYS